MSNRRSLAIRKPLLVIALAAVMVHICAVGLYARQAYMEQPLVWGDYDGLHRREWSWSFIAELYRNGDVEAWAVTHAPGLAVVIVLYLSYRLTGAFMSWRRHRQTNSTTMERPVPSGDRAPAENNSVNTGE